MFKEMLEEININRINTLCWANSHASSLNKKDGDAIT